MPLGRRWRSRREMAEEEAQVDFARTGGAVHGKLRLSAGGGRKAVWQAGRRVGSLATTEQDPLRLIERVLAELAPNVLLATPRLSLRTAPANSANSTAALVTRVELEDTSRKGRDAAIEHFESSDRSRSTSLSSCCRCLRTTITISFLPTLHSTAATHLFLVRLSISAGTHLVSCPLSSCAHTPNSQV